MARGRLKVVMPAPAAAAFEAFFNHHVRLRWDTLLSGAEVEGGGTHPHLGAITVNRGRGWKRMFALRTEFVSYDPPRSAAARMVQPTGLLQSWAATMVHRDLVPGQSEIIYAYSLRLRPRLLKFLLDPVAGWVFRRETKKRFAAMARYLQHEAECRTPS